MTVAPIGDKKLKPIITVKEARKLMGIDASKVSDDQLEHCIEMLTDVAEHTLRSLGSKVE